jgi:hypothetical protein
VLQDFRGREGQIREIDLTMGSSAVVRLRQKSAKENAPEPEPHGL